MSDVLSTAEFLKRYAKPRTSGGVAKKPANGRVRGAKKGMNKLEAKYAQYLQIQLGAGEILWWAYEPITLKLADDTRLTVDFAVQLPTGEIVLRDTKASTKKGKLLIEDDAAVKLRVAATYFPFRIEIATQIDREWIIKEVCP